MSSRASLKEQLRRKLLNIRSNLSCQRRVAAGETLLRYVEQNTSSKKLVLSYVSFGSEVTTEQTNQLLASQNNLVFPKVCGENLNLYRVQDLSKQLMKGNWLLTEPNPETCAPVNVKDISLALVPAISLDPTHHRLGYGKGFYDRLIPCLAGDAIIVGICYKELFLENGLPVETHDARVSRILLV